VHHPDHGCQDPSLAFGRRLTDTGLVASMGTIGDALANAVAESCLATLECELFDRHDWPTRQALRTAVFDFIKIFYNRQRRHSTLDYASPATDGASTPHRHPPHSQHVHENGATPKTPFAKPASLFLSIDLAEPGQCCITMCLHLICNP
jgi:hypothetical protein